MTGWVRKSCEARVRRGRGAHSRGFTLVELAVVLFIITIIAAMTFAALKGVKETATLGNSPKRLIGAMNAAKGYSQAVGRDVIFVLMGNNGAADSRSCGVVPAGTVPDPMTDDRCVRYWLLADVIDGANPRFDEAAMAAFDPADPEAAGDTLLSTGYLDRGVYIGQPAGYSPPSLTGSIYEGLDFGTPCGFCVSMGPERGYLRFTPDGEAYLPPTWATASGGALFLSVAAESNSQHLNTRVFAVLQPSGLATDHIGIAH